MTMCPCGSGKSYETCCEPLINGTREAQNAEEILRSRYTAFTKVAVSYIVQTTYPFQRNQMTEEGIKKWAESSAWDRLEILKKDVVKEGEKENIEFIAHYTFKELKQKHHEVASFIKHEGKWYFEDAQIMKPEQVRHDAPKPGRNDPCICGSGKKYKKCCG